MQRFRVSGCESCGRGRRKWKPRDFGNTGLKFWSDFRTGDFQLFSHLLFVEHRFSKVP